MPSVEIIHGDALEIVPKLGAFDYVITDPPYPVGASAPNVRAISSVMADARLMVDGMSQSLVAGVIRLTKRRERFAAWVMSDFRQVSFYSYIFRRIGLDKQDCVVWDKLMAGMGRPYLHRYELILYGANFTAQPAGVNLVAIKSVKRGKTHVFEKPPGLIERMCAKFPPGRVLDPFCGTGGVLLGCRNLGWDVVGIDIEKRFCDIARERLNERGLV